MNVFWYIFCSRLLSNVCLNCLLTRIVSLVADYCFQLNGMVFLFGKLLFCGQIINFFIFRVGMPSFKYRLSDSIL